MARGRGRPTLYKPEYAELARNYALLGATLDDIGPLLGVTPRAVKKWKVEHPEFAAAIEDGNQHADARVMGSLYQKCLAGDTTAIIWWTKNRLGWRDKTDAQLSGANGERLIFEISTTHHCADTGDE